MSRRRLYLLVGVALFAVGYWSWARLSRPWGDQKVSYVEANKSCNQSTSGSVSWRYCVFSAKGGTNEGVVYFLHGRNLDENIWNDETFYTSLIQKYWQENSIVPPKIVTVSFGPVWLLTHKSQTANSGLLELFQESVRPEIESKIGQPTYRIVMGESMGGVNALLLGLQTPETFDKIVSLCPPLYKDSPFSSYGTIIDTIKRTGADPTIIFPMLTLGKRIFADEAEWRANSPIVILEKTDQKKSPEIYLSCGLYDKYGNFEGSQVFADLASQRKLNIQWHPIYGGHCAIDIPSVANFLVAPTRQEIGSRTQVGN